MQLSTRSLVVLVVLALLAGLLAPAVEPVTTADDAPIIKAGFFDGLRKIGRAIGRIAGRIIGFPQKIATKATRWLGPVLGPVAAAWLTGKIVSNQQLSSLFKKAGEIKKIADDLQFVGDAKQKLQQAYDEQAGYHGRAANQAELDMEYLMQNRDAVIAEGELSAVEYSRLVLRASHTLVAQRRLAEYYNNKRVTDGDIASLFGRTVLQRLAGSGQLILRQLGDDLQRLIDPRIIDLIGSGGLDPETVLDVFLGGDIDRLLGGRGFGNRSDLDAIRDRLKERIKEELRRNRDFFKGNWRNEIDRIIGELTTELETGRTTTTTTAATTTTSSTTTTTEYVDPIPGRLFPDTVARVTLTWDSPGSDLNLWFLEEPGNFAYEKQYGYYKSEEDVYIQSLGNVPYLLECGTQKEWREITDPGLYYIWIDYVWDFCGDDRTGSSSYAVLVEYIDGREENFGALITYPDYSFDADEMTDADWAALKQQHYHLVAEIDLRELQPIPLP